MKNRVTSFVNISISSNRQKAIKDLIYHSDIGMLETNCVLLSYPSSLHNENQVNESMAAIR